MMKNVLNPKYIKPPKKKRGKFTSLKPTHTTSPISRNNSSHFTGNHLTPLNQDIFDEEVKIINNGLANDDSKVTIEGVEAVNYIETHTT